MEVNFHCVIAVLLGAVPGLHEGASFSSLELSEQCQLMLTGQHEQTPVTTKHEKNLYISLLFAVSYGSFQGRR
jgi:hypothetical protein